MQEQNLQNLTNAAKKVSNLSPTFLSAFAPLIDGQVNFKKLFMGNRVGGRMSNRTVGLCYKLPLYVTNYPSI